MPLAGKRPGARRVAAALFGLGGDALARGARAVTGREAPARSSPLPAEAPAAAAAPQAAVSAEEAVARLDAARERLRATIARPPDEEDPSPEPPPPTDPRT